MVALGGMCGCSRGWCVWDMMRYGDTINEQAVHILLECILVNDIFSGSSTIILVLISELSNLNNIIKIDSNTINYGLQ